MTTVLLTGFEPFAGGATNSSWQAVEQVRERWADAALLGSDDSRQPGTAAQLVTAVLPVEFGRAGDELVALIDRHRPDIVVAVGLAGGRASVTPERVAINVDDARIADNAGDWPTDRAVVKGGPAAYFSGLPVKAIVAAVRDAGVPASLSQTAGTFVCNHVMYRLMHEETTRRLPVRAGFIHVPNSPELAATTGEPSLEVDEIARALEIAIAVTIERATAGDIRSHEGAEH